MIRPVDKLFAVRIRVTVGTGLELRHAKASLTRFLTGLSASDMTFLARNLLVLPLQGIIRRRMIKPLPSCLPSAGRVAPVAALLELPLMRILMAIRTLRKCQAFVLKFDSPVDQFRMARLTLYGFMLTGQRVLRFCVREPGSWLPGVVGVACCAFLRESSSVGIAVAGDTVFAKAEKCTVRDKCAILHNILCAKVPLDVALPALQASMLSLECKSDRSMIK
jgi:hypothetical protein